MSLIDLKNELISYHFTGESDADADNYNYSLRTI